MKKLVFIVLVFTVFFAVNPVNAQKTEKVYRELTRKMLVSLPTETISHQNAVVSYWKIKNGGFYYIKEKQEFRGKYKSYNFTSKCNEIAISGLDDNKKKKKIEKELLADIVSGQD